MGEFITYIQSDSMQCGATCLLMICRFYGKKISADYLQKICIATAEGVSMLGIKQAAEELGFSTVGGLIEIEKISTEMLPCIVHWNQNHFVVLYKKKRNKYYIADPGKGLTTYTEAEFCKHCTDNTKKAIVMFLQPTEQFFENDFEGGKQERSFRFLWGYVKQYRSAFIKILLCLIIGSLLQLVLPFLTQSIVDVGIANKDIGFVWLILIGQLVVTISRTAADFVHRWLLLRISMRINIALVKDFFVKLLQLPMSFFDTKLMGDLMQRIGDHSRVNTFLTQQTLSVAFSLVSFVVFGGVLFVYNKLIFTIFLLGSIAYGGWMTIFLRRRKVIDYELFEQRAINNNKTYQFITAMQEIKLQNCERRRCEEWEAVQTEMFKVQAKSLKLQQTQEAGSIFINELKNIIITVVAATAVIDGSLTLGMMLAIQYIIGQLNSPIEQLMNFIYSIQDVKISLERINEVHSKDNEEDARRTRESFATNNFSIGLTNVDFKYDKHALTKTLDGVNIHIPNGRVTAIVGASGSGKTTLVKLMLGYYLVDSGNISIAGANIDEYKLKWWRSQCGVVMQDGVIFSESIARNIAVDDGEIDYERLNKAAEIANVKDFVAALPLKYNTIIGRDGINLSQGQKQRILIARAVYKNPQFIFLDEATNSLDASNERAIVEKLNAFYEGRTVIIVAHRLSTVRHADQIIVLDKGKVVEIGNHATLTAQRGAYYNLVKDQLEFGE